MSEVIQGTTMYLKDVSELPDDCVAEKTVSTVLMIFKAPIVNRFKGFNCYKKFYR